MTYPLEIKSQEGISDFCTGCVIASIAEEYVGEPCDESYSFAAGKLIAEQSLTKKGCPPKSALLAAIEYGVLPKSKSPFTVKDCDRNFLADWKNWEPYRKYAVKPFNSFYRAYDWNEVLKKTSIFAGIYWQSEWDKNPVITTVDGFNKFTPHEVRILGIRDGQYIIQNSRGKNVGDGGIWYLPSSARKYISHAYFLDTEPWSNPVMKFISLLT